MARNIEIKARVEDWDRLRQAAAGISDAPAVRIEQEDIFYRTRAGRLKLRVFHPASGELIYYERPDVAGPKQSDYEIHPTADPRRLDAMLAAACGRAGIVRKTRWLYMAGATRIHLDRVEGLGDFLELEVVLADGETAEFGRARAAELLARLGVPAGALIDVAYIDLLTRQAAAGDAR